MAATAVVPTAQQTPEQIAEQIATQAAQSQAPVTQEPAQLQREYVVQTETGQIYKGRTQQELIDQMKKAIENGTSTIAEFNREKRAVQQAAPVTDAPPAYDKAKYWELWAQDPDTAEDYRFQAKYGVTQKQAVEAIQQASQFTNEVRPQRTIAEWQSQSDFPTSDAGKMDSAAESMDKVWKEMFPEGAPVTKQNLEMVHSVCVKRGLYQPETALTQQSDPIQQFAGGEQPPPILQTGASTVPVQQVNPANMTPQQIKELLERMNGQR